MDITIEITGLDKMQKLSTAFPRAFITNANKAINQSMAAVQGNAFPLTPEKSTSMWTQIHDYTKHLDPKNVSGWIGSDLPYAVKVHNLYPVGTPYKHPSHNKTTAVAGFLQVAVDQARDNINRFFKEALDNTIKEAIT